MPWSSPGLKKDPCHVIHFDNHMFNQKINNHIFNSGFGGLLNHSPGLKYIVTKSRCTMPLTPPGWNRQNLSNQISRTESYQEAMTTVLAKRNKWKKYLLYKKTICSHNKIKTWEQNMRSVCAWGRVKPCLYATLSQQLLSHHSSHFCSNMI